MQFLGESEIENTTIVFSRDYLLGFWPRSSLPHLRHGHTGSETERSSCVIRVAIIIFLIQTKLFRSGRDLVETWCLSINY